MGTAAVVILGKEEVEQVFGCPLDGYPTNILEELEEKIKESKNMEGNWYENLKKQFQQDKGWRFKSKDYGMYQYYVRADNQIFFRRIGGYWAKTDYINKTLKDIIKEGLIFR